MLPKHAPPLSPPWIRYISPMMERTPTAYDLVGGEPAVRRLVDRFYDLMDTAPEAAGIRALHARA
jgi:truncated hemoglobin YjbI